MSDTARFYVQALRAHSLKCCVKGQKLVHQLFQITFAKGFHSLLVGSLVNTSAYRQHSGTRDLLGRWIRISPLNMRRSAWRGSLCCGDRAGLSGVAVYVMALSFNSEFGWWAPWAQSTFCISHIGQTSGWCPGAGNEEQTQFPFLSSKHPCSNRYLAKKKTVAKLRWFYFLINLSLRGWAVKVIWLRSTSATHTLLK